MNRWTLSLIAVLLAACAGAPAATPPASSGPSPTAGEHMKHEARHGGQLGMSKTLHIEIVSEHPGEYHVYLYDPAGTPLSLEGVRFELALIDASGNELFNIPASLADSGDFFDAHGGPTDLTQADARITVWPIGTTEPVEMDFTLHYQH
ncbi:MAG: hypothetical protein ACT4QE_09325 [Anaerolineales bacterium]